MSESWARSRKITGVESPPRARALEDERLAPLRAVGSRAKKDQSLSHWLTASALEGGKRWIPVLLPPARSHRRKNGCLSLIGLNHPNVVPRRHRQHRRSPCCRKDRTWHRALKAESRPCGDPGPPSEPDGSDICRTCLQARKSPRALFGGMLVGIETLKI
jgi:hypothetical protein